MPTLMATSPTSTRTSCPSAIRSSTGRSRSTAAIPATEWNGLHSFDESPNAVNPPNGWVYNSNNYPYSAAGANSPKQKDFPAYMDSGSENPRGVHAIRVLDGKKGFTLDSLIGAAYDSYMPEFEIQIPLLLKAHAATAASNPLKAKVADRIAALKDWDYRWSVTSVPTSVGDVLRRRPLAACQPGGAQGRHQYL